MFRSQMPKVYELRDLIADPTNPSAYFQSFDESLRDSPLKMQTWLAREKEFDRLDGVAWKSLKDEADFVQKDEILAGSFFARNVTPSG